MRNRRYRFRLVSHRQSSYTGTIELCCYRTLSSEGERGCRQAMYGASARTVQYRIPRPISPPHREAPPHDATRIFEFILLVEFGIGSGRSCHEDGPRYYWKTEYHRDARSDFGYTGVLRPLIDINPGGYHGRTFGAMAVTKSKIGYSEGVHPLMVGRTQLCCSKCSKIA